MRPRTVAILGGIAGAIIGALGILTYGLVATLNDRALDDFRKATRVAPWMGE